MPTYTALTTLSGKDAAEALGLAMERLVPEPTGVGVFEVEDGSGLWEVGGYFVEAPDAAGLALLAALHGAKDFAVSELPETDWVAHVRRELSPVEAGRFFVYGSHDAEKLPEDRVGLLIEAAMAFGTGHHGTTLGCLRAFDRCLDAGRVFERVADIGCGTAVLAMAAAKTTGAKIVATDLDPVAVDVARANLAANDLIGGVKLGVGPGFDTDAARAATPFDLIFANILKGPLAELAPSVAENAASGGIVILSGLLTTQADEIQAVYFANGFNLVHREDIVEWSTLTLTKSDGF